MTPEQAQLVTSHVPLARSLAGRRERWGYQAEYEDFLSDAYVGLCRAAQSYDPNQGLTFASYAFGRIKGAIADGRRNRDNLNRSDRRRSNTLSRAKTSFLDREQRQPTSSELAAEAGWTLEQISAHVTRTRPAYETSMQESSVRLVDDYVCSDIGENIRDPELTAEECLDCSVPELRDAFDALNEQQRFVISMYFWEDCTMSEIASVLGVTESRISQIKTKALDKLRAEMRLAQAV